MTEAKLHEVPTSSALCRHHWVIETPNGAVSAGKCKRCGIDKAFRNSSEEAQWDSDSFSLNGSRSRTRRTTSNS